MILISHRGNTLGRIVDKENNPEYIDLSLNRGFDCEIDIRVITNRHNEFFLGHDYPIYPVKEEWLLSRKNKLWIHCKNIQAVEEIKKFENINFFWHDKDIMTLTSKGYLWVYPGKQPVKDSIAVLPELNNDLTTQCYGICSDFISRYLKDS